MPGELYDTENESLIIRFFGRTPELRLIDFFMDNPNNDYTRQEIMEAIGMTKGTIGEKLPFLESSGVVDVTRKIGKAKLYQLNRENDLVQNLRAMELTLSAQIAELETSNIAVIGIGEEESKLEKVEV